MFWDTCKSLANAWGLLLSIIYNVRDTVQEELKGTMTNLGKLKSTGEQDIRMSKDWLVRHTSAHISSQKHKFLGLWHLDYFKSLLSCRLYVQEYLEYLQVEPCDVTHVWQIPTYKIVNYILHILDRVTPAYKKYFWL